MNIVKYSDNRVYNCDILFSLIGWSSVMLPSDSAALILNETDHLSGFCD